MCGGKEEGKDITQARGPSGTLLSGLHPTTVTNNFISAETNRNGYTWKKQFNSAK